MGACLGASGDMHEIVTHHRCFATRGCGTLGIGPRFDTSFVPRENPRVHERLGGITKARHQYLRQVLIIGAMAVARYAECNGTKRPWLVQLLARCKTKLAAVAFANENARPSVGSRGPVKQRLPSVMAHRRAKRRMLPRRHDHDPRIGGERYPGGRSWHAGNEA